MKGLRAAVQRFRWPAPASTAAARGPRDLGTERNGPALSCSPRPDGRTDGLRRSAVWHGMAWHRTARHGTARPQHRRALRSMVFIERRARDTRNPPPLLPRPRRRSLFSWFPLSPLAPRRRIVDEQPNRRDSTRLCLHLSPPHPWIYHLFFVPLPEKKKREEGPLLRR